jgi:hypothetical protein
MANLATKFYEFLNAALDSRIDELKKTEEPLEKGLKEDGTYGRKGLLFDPFFDQSYSAGVFKPKTGFLSNTILKQVSRKDPIVASIIDVRASQVAAACRKQTSRFDLGFKIQVKDKNQKQDDDEIRKLEEFILNCGYTEDRSDDDKMTFDQFGYMITRDMMIYGHAAIENVLREDQDLYAFLPLPAETIFYANKKVDTKVVEGWKDIWKKSQGVDEDKLDVEKVASGDYQFIQVIDGKVTEGFKREELIFARFALESDIDLNGYSVGPLERAISAITSHMQIENHQRQFFSHGTASKGLLILAGNINPAQLKGLQAQWNNQITGPINAWRTPILAGDGLKAEWIPLTASNRDMEYAAYQDHILRVICAAMAISPEEIGMDYLSKGTEQRSLSESSNEWKLTASRDRGLRPILTRLEAIINEEILPKFNEGLSKKYHFCFVGLDAETPEEEIARMQAEVQLHTSLNEIRKQAEMEPLQYGGSLILNPTYLQFLEKNMTKGEFMEKIMGVQGASQRPDLQYIPDPFWFQFQQMQMQMMMPQSGNTPGGEGQPGDPQDEKVQAEQEAMQQAQMEAIERYMQMNPELFKHHQKYLEKYEDLKKAEKAHKRINTEHIDKLTNMALKDIRMANEELIKEITAAISDDLKNKMKKDDK